MAERPSDRRRIATLPNVLSLLRIALVPVFFALIVRPGTEVAGLVLFGAVASTDWVDGYIARRTGQVTDLGKVLDPVADRLAIAAALVAVVIRDAFPLWAAAVVVGRDLVVIAVGAAVLVRRGVRIDVRRTGKAATFLLMVAVPSVAWGRLDLPLGIFFAVLGWGAFAVGIGLYYWTAALYARDMKRAIASGEAARDG